MIVMNIRQKAFLIDLLEGVPSIAFLIFLRNEAGLELAGWIGSLAALLAFAALYLLNCKSHPVLLGVNLHLLFATPVIIGIDYAGATQLASFLASHAHKGVLLTVCIVGVLETMFMAGGFVGAPDLPKKTITKYSRMMLVVGLTGVCWAFGTEASAFIAVLVSLTAMIGLRNFLLARWQDNNSGAAALFIGLPISGHGSETAV
ncbi:hypothetical protein [Roseibium aggregatum]|uniref:Uncharacterized protein n=1 Tax=Roseibium aggregatum TaxID=187304 RepID=A0A939EAC4_9HYPH|nr:hypothetical protein [Roseibium aggregatum]MBN9669751.1 hypothetical protein [Roseibium aggregatum]